MTFNNNSIFNPPPNDVTEPRIFGGGNVQFPWDWRGDSARQQDWLKAHGFSPDRDRVEIMNGDAFRFRFTPAPPPKSVRIDPRADELCLIPGLRVETGRDYPWRCSACNTLQPSDSEIVRVPAGIRIGDNLQAIAEFVRLTQFNGCSSGWCVPCAQKLSRPAPKTVETNQIQWTGAEGYKVQATPYPGPDDGMTTNGRCIGAECPMRKQGGDICNICGINWWEANPAKRTLWQRLRRVFR